MNGFREKVILGINSFINNYKLDFNINLEQTTEGMLGSIFEAFRIQKSGEKIYVIIDEYDHFANELLSFRTEDFKQLVSKNGKIRKWYEILKEGTEKVVDRIFITGVAPITLDSLTSGFNISKDITRDSDFNEMIGFTHSELVGLMDYQGISKQEQEMILPVMKENYDGYNFSEESHEFMYNSNMSLYFLSEYVRFGKPPARLVDVNIASDYSKLGKMLDLCKGEEIVSIMEDVVSGKGVTCELTEKFNPAIEFTEKDMISMLYYLGYLTISENVFDYAKLRIPNKVMREIYSDYFLKMVKRQIDLDLDVNYSKLALEIALEGKIDKTIELLQKYLNNLSNRDYQRFDEKYVKLIFYCIAMNFTIFNIRSEMEFQRKYPDLLIVPKNEKNNSYSIMIEFKYLKKTKILEKQKEARAQIEEYAKFEEIKNIPNLRKYTVIAVVDKIYVEEI